MTKKNNYRNAGRKKVVNGRKITKTIPEHLIIEYKKFANLWLKSKENENIIIYKTELVTSKRSVK